MHALVTGAAGFIGSHVVDRLLADGWAVTAVDNFDEFYAPRIKWGNIAWHRCHPAYRLVVADVRDYQQLSSRLPGPYDAVIHLAARAGVGPSMTDHELYEDVNVRGTQHMLALARMRRVPKFILASSSSVYGVNPDTPWREDDAELVPISPYAVTKGGGEFLGHMMGERGGLQVTALRFFTVYGPRQRPDLAVQRFVTAMLLGTPIRIYGDGLAERDYTFIGDVVSGVTAALSYDGASFDVFNIGTGAPVSTRDLVNGLEKAAGITANINFVPARPGDVPCTWADTTKAERVLGYRARTSLADGLRQVVEWNRWKAPNDHVA